METLPVKLKENYGSTDEKERRRCRMGNRKTSVNGRCKVKALLSIHPKYAASIFAGEKRYEYRRRLPKKRVSCILIYATAPISKIIGEARVVDTLIMDKAKLWQHTKSYGGISEKEFDRYFTGVDIGGAILLSSPILYKEPLTIERIGLTRAPQSFCYLSGEDE